VIVLSHPAAASASVCASGCWSRVLTRAYPTTATDRTYRERTSRAVVHGHGSRDNYSGSSSGLFRCVS